MPTSSHGPQLEELRHGWKIVLAAALAVGLGISPLPLYSIGILTKPLGAHFGWTRAEVQAFLSFSTTGVIVGSPLLGFLVDRFGLRQVLVYCIAGFAVAFILLGVVTQGLVSFYALALCVGLFGAGTNSVAWSRVIFARFTYRPGLALGIALSSTGISAALLPSLTTLLLTKFGWRGAYIGLGLLPALVTLPVTLLCIGPALETNSISRGVAPSQMPGIALREAIIGYRFWFIGLGFFLVCLGTSGVIPHLVPLLTDRGYTAFQAARIAAYQGIALLIGRLLTGYLVDRVWAPGLAAISLGIPAFACIVLSGGLVGETMTAVAAGAIGFAGGAEFDLIAYLTRRYFGLGHYGTIYGVLYALFACATVIAPPLFGLAFDQTGSYHFVLRVAGGCFLTGAALILALGRYPAGMLQNPS